MPPISEQQELEHEQPPLLKPLVLPPTVPLVVPLFEPTVPIDPEVVLAATLPLLVELAPELEAAALLACPVLAPELLEVTAADTTWP